MKAQISFALATVVFCGSLTAAFADYTLILKNGRRITIQSYREEKGLIKFNGLGGEIGIDRDQIEVIRPGASGLPGDLNVTLKEASNQGPEDTAIVSREGEKGKTIPGEDERAKEEKEYLDKIRSLTERLKSSQDRYAEAIRGTASSDPTQLVTDEQIRARQDDVEARFKDAQNNPSEPAPVKLVTPSPFTSLPPTITEVQPTGRRASPFDEPQTLTDRQRDLLDLRNQAVEIEKERERLINELRQKNYNSASLFDP